MKKRILSFLCVFCLICTMLPTVAAAWSAPTLSVEASLEGSQIKTTVKLGPHDIGAINFTLNYDSSKLTLSEAKGQNFLNGALIGTTMPGKITPVWYNVAGTNSSTEIPILTATFDVIAGQSGNVDFTIDTISITDKSGDNEVTSPGPGSNLATSITIPKAPISDVSAITAKVDAPEKGTALDTTVDLSGATAYTGTVEWFEGAGTSGSSASGTAAAGQVYTAKITLTANSGESFANSLDGNTTGDGYQIKRTSEATLELTKTFPATADKDPASITTPPAATTLTYNGSAQNLVTAGSGVTGGTLKYRLGESGLWNTDIPKATNAGDYTVYYMVKGDADHSDIAPVAIPVTITKKSITPTVTVTGSYTYNDGNPIIPAFTVEDSGTGLAATDYIAEFTNNINAGTGTITVKEAANGNYTFAQVQQTFTIGQESHGNETASGSARHGAEGTVDLRSYIVPGGTATYAFKTDSDSVLDGVPSLDGGVLKFKFVDNSSKVGKSATATINVTSTNYTNYAITVTLDVTDKVTPTVTAPTANTLTYNGTEQVLINAGSTTGGELQYSLTSGSGYSTGLPKAKDADSYNVYYKVVGDAEYADVAENYITVTIDKKAATVAPKSFTITKGSAIPTFELAYTGLVGSDTLTPSETPAFTCYESDGITPVSASTPAGTYTITWTNESSATFTGANNYHLTKTATATLTIKNKKPSGGSGSGSGSGGGSSLPIKPVDDAYSQPAGCVSDTIGEVNVSGAYQFRLTSTNGSTPVVTLSGTAFHGVFASQEGNDYFYKVYADGQPGQTCIVTVNGTTVARLTIVSASSSGVISDTTAPFTVPQGGAYQFRLTADTKPTMTAGSPSFTVAYVGNEGKDWFFKVYAVGQPGDGCGFYINGAPVPVAVAHIS